MTIITNSKIISIKDLKNGVFIQKSGWEPSFVKTRIGDVFKANIIGRIINIDDNNFIIDDTTGTILLRTFMENNNENKINLGDVVLVIGKPRIFNNEIYLVYDIIKKLNNGWLLYRLKELSFLYSSYNNVVENKEELNNSFDIISSNSNNINNNINNFVNNKNNDFNEENLLQSELINITETNNLYDLLINTIKELDKNNNNQGAPLEKIYERLKEYSDLDKLILNLKAEGEIFEIKNGYFKLLE